MNGNDGLLWPDTSCTVGHRHRFDAVNLNGCLGQLFENRLQFILPSIKLQPKHIGISFGFSGDADETDNSTAALGVQSLQECLWVKPG